MKFYILLPLALIVGCTKTADVQKPPADAELIAVYSHVGQWHNEGLEAVYNGIKDRSVYSFGTFKKVIDKVIFSHGIKEERFVFAAVEQYDNIITNTLLRDAVAAMRKAYHAGEFDKLIFIRDEFLKSGGTLTDRKSIIGIASVFKSSCEYWQANAKKWNDLIDHPRVAIMDDPKDIPFADAVGAGIGAVRGAITGGLAGTIIPGIGNVSGAAAGGLYGMISGAVTASVTTALWQKIKSWINWNQVPACSMANPNVYNSVCSQEDSVHWAIKHIQEDSLFVSNPLNGN